MVDDPRVDALRAALPGSVRAVRAPGRVNLIGEHTDYSEGFCLPMAIDRDVVVAVAPRPDDRVVVRSLDLDGTVDVPADGSARPNDVEPPWGRMVAAVLAVLAERGRAPTGFDAVAASTVPLGAGLSSSAAFAVGFALAAAGAGDLPLAGTDLARAAQEAEHRASGVPCGLMDQMASVHGRAGHALLLDCRSLSVQPVPLPDSMDVLVVHSGLPRRLEDSEYAQRRQACEAAAARAGVASLRDAALDDVAGDPVARHVVSENARTLAFADALRRGDAGECGRLMAQSHASLRDDLRVSTPELDLLVRYAGEDGALGARLTGAGFGGCIVALTPPGAAAGIGSAVTTRYGARTGLTARAFVVHAVDGAGSLAVDGTGDESSADGAGSGDGRRETGTPRP